MSKIANDELLNQLKWRYAVKIFDPSKKIPTQDWAALENALILTPSSYGLQPWKFLVITDPTVKAKLTPITWNQKQVEACSHFVVMCARDEMQEQDIDEFLALISTERGVALENLEKLRKMLIGDVVTGERSAIVKEWATRQVYIALGNLMTSAALLGVDSCPMEGLEPLKYDEALNLKGSGFHTVVACALGYRHPDDKYATIKKVRYPASKVVQHL